jgi:crotonobetainyl-CoA:carnitine CoA-transferase CaiB-like acyl-CoA transferase
MYERGMVYQVERPEGGAVPQIGTGIQLDGRHNVPRSAPPRLGEHSRAVLSRLGYDVNSIRHLEDAGII